MPEHTFDDFQPGQVYELGSKLVNEEEIVAFAQQFDPQPFHLDPEAAKESVFGGLIASGWHTGAMWMRLYVDSLLGGASGQGSSGVEELRWLAPVRPGDTLSGRLIVLEVTSSDSHPERGTIRIRGEMENQEGVTVMSMVSRARFARRSPQ
jgi:acyl dehydratase